MSIWNPSNLKEFILNHTFFHKFPSLVENLAKFNVSTLQKNEILISEGTLTKEEIYLILDGELEVFSNTTTLTKLKAGNFIGELILFEINERTISAKAGEPASVLVIPLKFFNDLKQENRQIWDEILNHFIPLVIEESI